MKTLDEVEPPYDDESACPQTLNKTARRQDVLYMAGQGPEDADLMFISSFVTEEEIAEVMVSSYGVKVRQKPRHLRGSCGVFNDVALSCGLDIDKEARYTALVRWLLPRAIRMKPPKRVLHWGLPMLQSEINQVKPKIIVCLGKQAFDMLRPKKMKFKDAHGAWFWSEEYQAHLYLMHHPINMVTRPELFETFRVDIREIQRRLKILQSGLPMPGDQINERVVSNYQELDAWVAEIKSGGYNLFSLDCEWHGRAFRHGQLRSMQLAWTDFDAVYFRFRDDQNQFAFGLPDGLEGELISQIPENVKPLDRPKYLELLKYRWIGKKLKPVFSGPDYRFVGHHFSADSPWVNYWLEIETLGRCVMDTEFAQQTVDEASELGLERGIAMRYTTLGRYDIDLTLWKNDNRKICQRGYGYIPDPLIIPYGIRDVVAVFRAVPLIERLLDAQGLLVYYRTILNPYVTDLFSDFSLTGLPIDVELLDSMRGLYHFVRHRAEKEFRVNMEKEAIQLMLVGIVTKAAQPPVAAFGLTTRVISKIKQGGADAAVDMLKDELGLREANSLRAHVEHLECAADFNIRSSKHLRRWLFDVHGLTPIKSTNQKAKGLPSQSWEKVLELPPERQALFSPAVDAQTLNILQDKVHMLQELLYLNMVGNVCKAFLKEPDVWVDEDTGEKVVEECGLHQWLLPGLIDASTPLGAATIISCMYSLTGTSRPRTWAPNVLNLPKYVNVNITKLVLRILKQAVEDDTLPEELRQWATITDHKDIPSVRSVVTAPPGWCQVESDFKAAEMHGLSVISNDTALMKILNEPDPEWALLKPERGAEAVRVKWGSPKDNGVPLSRQDPEMLMSIWKNGSKIREVTQDDLKVDAEGKVVHASFDIHWSLAEWCYEKPRELMHKDVERAAGKAANFCLSEGQLVSTKDRGEIPIQDVVASDYLWDGNRWVTHGGVVSNGLGHVIEYQGLQATGNHEVWTEEVGKIYLQEAAERQLTLVGRSGQRPKGGEVVNLGLRETYDILDAGSLNRFVCSGVLVSNSSAYGASPVSVERKIESDSGHKPEEGTGQKLLDAIKLRQPQATKFLEEMAEIPKTTGYYRAASGRICHCVTHERGASVGWRTRNAIESALGRELRNYPMQESVGSTAARAGVWLSRIYRRLGLKAKVMTILYDSVVTLCPLNERWIISRLHQLFMSDFNTWEYGEERRKLQYQIDTEFVYQWSTSPKKSEAAQLSDPSWNPAPPHLKWLENWSPDEQQTIQALSVT